VFNWSKWATVLRTPTPRTITELAPHIVSNEDVWVVLTYLQLTARGFKASIGPSPLRGRINICDGIHVLPEHLTPEMFVVGCRGDGHYPAVCHTVIHQNTLRLPGQRSMYIPQWAQPGLRPRDPGRTRIQNIAFFGHSAVNLMRCFHDPSFQAKMQALGYTFLIRDRGERVQWNDYREIDLVLSMRAIPHAHLQLKPANKLINAWLAGTPAIIGPEPAVHALRRSALDYFEAREPEQVLQLLSTLRERSDLYDAMAAHGRKRAALYTDDAVAHRWRITLRAISSQYRQWHRQSNEQLDREYWRRLRNHELALQRHQRDIHRPYWQMGFGRQWWTSTQPPRQHTELDASSPVHATWQRACGRSTRSVPTFTK
jgi:hypothetical protein